MIKDEAYTKSDWNVVVEITKVQVRLRSRYWYV